MAHRHRIGGTGTARIFRGEKKRLSLHVLDAAGAPVDVAAWTDGVTVLARLDAIGTPVLTISGSSVEGSYNATKALNTQRLIVTFTDTQTSALAAGVYAFSVKRPSDPKTVLVFGEIEIEETTQ